MTNINSSIRGDQVASDDLVVVRASDLAALRALVDAVDNSSDNAGCDESLTVIESEPLKALARSMKTLKGEPLGDLARNAARYLKLRGWMSSNVKEGWRQVEQLGSVAAWQSWEDVDAYLDSLPDCDVGQMSGGPGSKPETSGAPVGMGEAGEHAMTSVVIQEGGSSKELYLHVFDDAADAEAFRFSVRDAGSYRTTPAIQVSSKLVSSDFLHAVEQLLSAFSTEMSYPEGAAPAQDEAHQEGEPNPRPRNQGERNA